MDNISLSIYKIAANFLPANSLFAFLDNYIKSGYISEGQIDLNLDISSPSIKTLTAENLSGKLSIYDLNMRKISRH